MARGWAAGQAARRRQGVRARPVRAGRKACEAGVGRAADRRREVGEDLAEEGGHEQRQCAAHAGEGRVQREHRGQWEAAAARHCVAQNLQGALKRGPIGADAVQNPERHADRASLSGTYS